MIAGSAKQGMGALENFMDHGVGCLFLAVDTVPDYTDKRIHSVRREFCHNRARFHSNGESVLANEFLPGNPRRAKIVNPQTNDAIGS